MSDNPNVLGYLREQFARAHGKIDEPRSDVLEVKQRLTTFEIQVGSLVATEQSHYAQKMLRMDRVEQRLDRIERWLDLTHSVA